MNDDAVPTHLRVMWQAIEQQLVGGKQGFGVAAVLPEFDWLSMHDCTLVNHDLNGIGDKVFALCLDIPVELLLNRSVESRHRLEVINSNDRLIADKRLRLFDQAHHTTVFDLDDAQLRWIFDNLREHDDVSIGILKVREIGVEHCIRKEDQG